MYNNNITPAQKLEHQLNIQHDTIKTYTPQPSTPIERAGSKHKLKLNPIPFPTIKHITPQPSTPIERAGSDIWKE
jgi:hypothetical protein